MVRLALPELKLEVWAAVAIRVQIPELLHEINAEVGSIWHDAEFVVELLTE